MSKKLNSVIAIILDKVETLLVVNAFEYMDNSNPKYLKLVDNEVREEINGGTGNVPKLLLQKPSNTIEEFIENGVEIDVMGQGGSSTKTKVKYGKNIGGTKAILPYNTILNQYNFKINKKNISLTDQNEPEQVTQTAICRPTGESNSIKYDYKEEFSFMKSPIQINYETTRGSETIEQIVNNFKSKLNDSNLDKIILFVFGITGSGKDTLLNHLYGIIAGKSITDKDEYKGKQNPTQNVNGENVTVTHLEDWILSSLGEQKDEYKAKLDTVGKHMRAPTPFNPQSTRGFNIKKFYVKVNKIPIFFKTN